MKISQNATGFVRIAAASPRVHVGEPRKSAERAVELIREAAQLSADVLVFPELSATGYTAADLFLRAPLLEKAESNLERILEALTDLKGSPAEGLIVVAGAPVRAEGKLFNCA